MSNFRSLDRADVKGKRVLVRVDHNITYNENGILRDDLKMRVTIPTIEYLIDHGAKIILLTHVGRPEGQVEDRLRTQPIAEHLKSLSDKIGAIKTITDIVGSSVQKQSMELQPGDILYLENVRFDPREKTNDKEFIEELAQLADIYVNEAFPSLHSYEEASTCGVARRLDAYAGFHLIKEVEYLRGALKDPRRPLVFVTGGAKMKTKIPVIESLLDKADDILIGGAIANTFIAARGFDIGTSRYDAYGVEKAQELMKKSQKEGKSTIHIPCDVVLASGPKEDVMKINSPLKNIEGDMSIFDIGKMTIQHYVDVIEKAGMVIWNGPLGLYELNQFSHATKCIAEAIQKVTKEHNVVSIIGGGDTIDFHTRYKCSLDAYSFVSMGGGAMLELLSGKRLPALEAVQD